LPERRIPGEAHDVATLILLRHGQSEWNERNLFTGWVDVDLSELGRAEATDSGRLLVEEGLAPDVVHTSLQRRAIRTADLALDTLDRLWIPVRRSWRLNERHYGALQGLDKAETAAKYGADQVKVWRRSYSIRPPHLGAEQLAEQRADPRYADLPDDLLPASECLADVVDRMLPYWYDDIVPDLEAERVVLVAAHGNSLRALVKHLDGSSDDESTELNIPTGIPLVYELGEHMAVVGAARYLGDPEAVAAATDAVAHQAG
jgi:2,3-bisphosphoglycerate-dependent phosphoglycerate mutase